MQSDTRSGSPVLREFVLLLQIGARTRPITLWRARVPVCREFILRADEKLDCVFGVGEGDSRIRGEFDLVNHFGIAVGRAKSRASPCEKSR